MSEYAKTAYWLDCADYDLQTAKAMLEPLRCVHVPSGHRERVESNLCSATTGQRIAIYPQPGAPCQPVEDFR